MQREPSRSGSESHAWRAADAHPCGLAVHARMGWNDERSVPSQPPTEPPSARPCPRSSRECGRRTQPQHRIAAHGDDDRLLRSLAQDAMQLAPKDGEARSLSLVTPPHRANEDRHLVDARRDKLLASGRTHPEFGQLIAKTGRSNACRHADNRRRARPPKQGNVCTSVREQTGKRLSRGVESPPRAPAFVGVGVRWPSRSFTSTSERVDSRCTLPGSDPKCAHLRTAGRETRMDAEERGVRACPVLADKSVRRAYGR